MKLNFNRRIATGLLMASLSTMIVVSSCKKNDHPNHGQHPAAQSSEVLDKWMTMQLRLMRNATGIANHAFSRHYTYAGIAALESISPGLSSNLKKYRKWNGLTGLPTPELGNVYFYPANANAALASINRSMFPNASTADRAAIDSLESALKQLFLTTQSTSRITKSSDFGKAVATAVFNWAETDGYKNANNPYTPPTGPGLWIPTPPTFTNAATPFWGNNRPVVIGSTVNTMAPAPITYSTEPGSPFYNMVKEVYDASLVLTSDQKAMATFWKDVPGATSPGHWLSILQQVIRKKGTNLEKAAIAYALTGASINDALISCVKTKYRYSLVRPITYIRDVMGIKDWSPFLGTPAHPEYTSAHSSLSGAAALAFQHIFGNLGTFTDRTYDYLGYGARTYNSFKEIGEEASKSRLYGGIHYKPSLDIGLEMGRKVAANIFSVGNGSH